MDVRSVRVPTKVQHKLGRIKSRAKWGSSRETNHSWHRLRTTHWMIHFFLRFLFHLSLDSILVYSAQTRLHWNRSTGSSQALHRLFTASEPPRGTNGCAPALRFWLLSALSVQCWLFSVCSALKALPAFTAFTALTAFDFSSNLFCEMIICSAD